MAIYIANPIYDSVFKYLLEDERVAKTFISGLIQKKVTNIEMRPHEYTNITKDNVSVFRIDFAAKIFDETTQTEQLILIELQKAWLPSEIMRFRKYLGTQYCNDQNTTINPINQKTEPLHIISIYLLGHTIDELKEPIVYITRNYLNQNLEEIKNGVPNKFIESLTHDLIVVQIPYLTNKTQTRLEKILNIFDQSKKTENDHLLAFDDKVLEKYDDTEIDRIFWRLVNAAASPDVRMDMNVEDEFASELDHRDQIILQKDLIIANINDEIALKNNEINQQLQQLSQQEQQLSQQEQQLSQQEQQLSQQENKIKSAIKNLANSGMDINTIAKTFNLTINYVKDILK